MLSGSCETGHNNVFCFVGAEQKVSDEFDWHFAMQELNATAIGALRGHSAAEDAAALKEKVSEC